MIMMSLLSVFSVWVLIRKIEALHKLDYLMKSQLRSPHMVPEFVANIVEVFHGFSALDGFHVF
jgi:ribosomal protein S19